MKRKISKNYKFEDSMIVNDETFYDYLNRFKRIALSLFEWVNLPSSMNEEFLEKCLYYTGQASLLKSEKYGYINTKSCNSGYLNIYNNPTQLNCFSYNFHETRKLYSGLNPLVDKEQQQKECCVLVKNNYDKLPTAGSMELFAWRLYLAQRTCDVNISSQRFPVMVVGDEKQRLMLENLYSQYDGNQPFIFGNKNQLNEDMLKAIRTEAPYVVDKINLFRG